MITEPVLTIRKPFFFVLAGAFLLSVILLGFLLTDRNSVQAQNRYLILKNDSIMSVNILLADSLKQRSMDAGKPKMVSRR